MIYDFYPCALIPDLTRRLLYESLDPDTLLFFSEQLPEEYYNSDYDFAREVEDR
jgi:hypothetical protein